MDSTLLENLKPPRFETSKPLLVAGIAERCTHENEGAGIPNLWNQFHQKVDGTPARIGNVAYGVCWNYRPGQGFDYLSGVEVKHATKLSTEFTAVDLDAREYAVFTHRDHVSTIGNTLDKIWHSWAPQSGLNPADKPSFERYGEEFNPQTGMGGMEIWIPLEA